MQLPTGYGSVQRLPGKRRKPYAVRITVGWSEDGKQIRRYVGYYATRKEALDALAEYHAHPYDVDAHKTTFADMYNKWIKLTYLDCDKDIPHNYQAAYKNLEALHDMTFADIRRHHIQSTIDASSLGYPSKRMMKTLCHKLFSLAIDYEIVTTDYSKDVTLPQKELSRKHHPFDDDELSLLWQHTDDFGAQIALVLSYTGFRPTELLHIKREDVHLDKRIIFGGMKTEAGRNRAVPIAQKILPIITQWLLESQDCDCEYLVVSHKDGKALYNYDRMRYQAWETSSVLCHMKQRHLPHDGRHTCTTRLDNVNTNIKITQLILGHRADNITRMVYTHKTYEQLIEAIDRI